MTLQFIEPLRLAWNRMLAQLFHPFDLSKWIIVGFTCWLVRLGEGGGPRAELPVSPGGDHTFDGSLRDLHFDPSSWSSWWESFWQSYGVAFVLSLVGCVIVVILVVVLLVLWLSARGHFLFLDNVVHDRAGVVEPWKEYRRQGNSLFLWRLGFILVCIVAMLAAAAPGIFTLISAAETESGARVAVGLVVLLIPVLLVAVALAYVDLFLTDFVVPIMYQRRLKTNDAWRVFLPKLREHGAEFLLYGLLVLALHVAVGLVITAVGFATCCIAFLVLMIPVLGTVILLPLHVTYRLFSVEFLGQLGPDLQLLAAPAGAPPPPLPETS
jgi:hypothetical protein